MSCAYLSDLEPKYNPKIGFKAVILPLLPKIPINL